MVTHTGQRAIQCHICDNSFTRASNLKAHVVLHTEEELAFQCDICEKSFTQASNLKTHMRDMVTHTGQRASQCHICEKSFTLAHSQKRHMVTHAGDESL